MPRDLSNDETRRPEVSGAIGLELPLSDYVPLIIRGHPIALSQLAAVMSRSLASFPAAVLGY